MKIINSVATKVPLTLDEPFTIAYSSIKETTNYFLTLTTNTGLTGFGCSAYDEEVTGENATTISSTLENVIIPFLDGKDPLQYASLLDSLYSTIPDQPTALAAADMALYDLLGKIAQLPVYKLLGGNRNRIKTSITIGIEDVQTTVEKALMWKKRGFLALKLKGGLSLDEDIERMIRVREAVSDEIDIYFDANQGYSIEDAKKAISNLRHIGATFIEQPCDKTNLDQFKLLQGELPVVADESVLGPEDALSLATISKVDLYNIKLAKTGGIRRALQLDAVAQSASSHTMVGCMDEAGLGIAAALHFCLSSPNVQYADLDGHVEFIDDPSYDSVIIKDGYIYPQDGFGLGALIR
ncbi:MAG: mandelate racemase/muconate lactonizing enzyme family protein [Sphaerochaetaceae bacterium]